MSTLLPDLPRACAMHGLPVRAEAGQGRHPAGVSP